MSAIREDSTFASPERQRIFTWIVLALCAVYVGRLAYLQIIQGSEYRSKAEGQAIKQIKVEPFRGTLYDRDGRAIVRNAPGFSVTVTPYECTTSSIAALAEVLGAVVIYILLSVLSTGVYGEFEEVVKPSITPLVPALGRFCTVKFDQSVLVLNDVNVRWSFVPSKYIAVAPSAVSTVPAFTIRGWLAVVACVAFTPLVLWSYHVTM